MRTIDRLVVAAVLSLAVLVATRGTEAQRIAVDGITSPTFGTVETGQGPNELYDMDQDVLTTSAPSFDAVTIGPTNGVVLSDDGDGALTFTGAGTGQDENLTLNFDDSANGVVVTSTTGVTFFFSTPGFLSNGPASGLGYFTGAGCTVTQATNRTTGVTCAGMTGFITTNNASLAAGAEAAFVVTNTSVAATDTIVVSARSGQTAGTSIPVVTGVASGSFTITLTNLHASSADTGAMIINFVVFRSAGS